MADPPASLPPPPSPHARWALFLDVDGCLLDFAATPDGVVVPPGLHDALATCAEALGGALALVSGRSVDTLDALFSPLVLPAAGLHGLERRHGDAIADGPRTPVALAAVRRAAGEVAATHPGSVVEDKGVTLALHWRSAGPGAGHALQAFALEALPQLPGYRLQHGKQVVELRPGGNGRGGADADKGSAIAAFLEEPPFAGRVPVFAGDDLTDEHGFAVANARGGISILVGQRAGSAARHGLRDPADVRAWLARLPGDLA